MECKNSLVQINHTAQSLIDDLGKPPCECIEEIKGYCHAACECGNEGDLASAEHWCGEVNTIRDLAKKGALREGCEANLVSGYRLLNDGEVMQEGDEVYIAENSKLGTDTAWSPINKEAFGDAFEVTLCRPIRRHHTTPRPEFDTNSTTAPKVKVKAIQCPNPNCGDTGCYPEDDGRGGCDPAQCEFCYTHPNSVFNAVNEGLELPAPQVPSDEEVQGFGNCTGSKREFENARLARFLKNAGKPTDRPLLRRG